MSLREALPVSNPGTTPRAPVALAIPADKDYVVLARSAASHLGARVGFSMQEIGDLRLAVSEACVLFLSGEELELAGDTVQCTFTESGGALHVTVHAAVRGDGTPPVDGFGWSLLSALVDDLRWIERDEHGFAGVFLSKTPGTARDSG
jgi:serine/threonine-protein kinase RsbW